MKSLLLMVLCAAWMAAPAGRQAIVANTGEVLHGPVKSITEHHYGLTGKRKKLRLTNIGTLEFNGEGQQTSGTLVPTAIAETDGDITYVFSSPGVVEKAIFKDMSREHHLATRTYFHDDSGRIGTITDEAVVAPFTHLKTIRHYDSQGRMAKEEMYNKDGSLDQLLTVKYDTNSRVSKTFLKTLSTGWTQASIFHYSDFDEYNNWGTCEIEVGGKTMSRVKREITYY